MKNRRSIGLLVLSVLLGSIFYLWQPWRGGDTPTFNLGLDLKGGLRVVLQADGAPSADDLQTARSVIEHRVNAFGVAEPLVQTSGENRIVVELPGLTPDDQERALGLIGQRAVLEFRLVKPSAADAGSIADLEPLAFSGEIVATARADFDHAAGAAPGSPVVTFDIRHEDAGAFGDFTGSHIGRRMAIVLDDEVISAPTIQGRIADHGQITGLADLNEASDLALVLRSGSLPIALHVEEVRAMGPTLGADAIRSGLIASVVGGAAVVASIFAYYGPLFGGVLALGLLYAMLVVFGAMAGLGATLTLPGLAGLVLTIGAAVDGNVISFERVKEELRAGRRLRLAMKNGFRESLSAIVDANVTTLLAAAALYQYTSGPVRGFAVTLAIGIVASVFANTVVVPFVLDLLTLRTERPRFPVSLGAPAIPFMKLAPAVLIVSALLALGSLTLVALRPLALSADFTGGTTLMLRVPQATTIDEVREAVDSLALPGVSGAGSTIQEVRGGGVSSGKDVSVRVGALPGPEAQASFARSLAAELDARVLQADFVGPAVGADLRGGAVRAVAVAFALILVYVGWRFWPNTVVAIAAVLTSVHDVGIVLGVLNLSGMEFSIPVLAALLFVVGYSLNDSIIVADRIRENLRRLKGASYREAVDAAINQTLSRTIMTSATTLLPVVAIVVFGGSVLRQFGLTLLVGIAFGTYSSIFVMAPIVVWFKSLRRRRGGRASVRKTT